MKEYGHFIQKSFVNGLRPDDRTPVGAPYLEYCANLKPTEFGLVSPEIVTDPLGLTVAHPYPQILRGESVTLKASGTSLALVDESDWTTTPISVTGTINAEGPWQMASFHDLYVLSNGHSLVWQIPSNDGNAISNAANFAMTVLNHNDRLIMGGFREANTWFSGTRWGKVFSAWRETQAEYKFSHEDMAFGGQWIVWSELGGGSDDVPFLTLLAAMGYLGNTIFDKFEEIIITRIEQRKIGMCRLRSPGYVLRCEALGNTIAAFSANSVSRLTPNENNGYDEEEVAEIGIAGRGACSTGPNSLVFVDTNRNLWRWNAGENPSRLGYKEYLPTGGGELIISYDPVEQDYWITDGAYCYVLTRTGLGGPMDVRPTSLFRDGDGALIGVSDHPSSFIAEFRTVASNMNRRDSKKCVSLNISAEDLTAGVGRVDWRVNMNSDYVSSPWKAVNYQGVSWPNVSFVDGKFSVKGSASSTTKIDSMDVRFQAEGRRFQRGTVPDEVSA